MLIAYKPLPDELICKASQYIFAAMFQDKGVKAIKAGYTLLKSIPTLRLYIKECRDYITQIMPSYSFMCYPQGTLISYGKSLTSCHISIQVLTESDTLQVLM